jgi:predicted CoA-binding protein
MNLDLPKTVAMVGLSDKPDRPSYGVGLYLKNHGFNIIPVNPTVKEIFGIRSYSSILEIPDSIKIDIVDIFRKPDQVVPIIEEVIKSKRKPIIWMQEGVGSPEAKALVEKNGMEVVMDMCMMKEHKVTV